MIFHDFMIFSWFFMIFMIFSWKIKNFQKVQNFSHSIWKVPKMFCHLEIHWGALGRRNIDHEASGVPFLQKGTFFKNNDTLAVGCCPNLRWRLSYSRCTVAVVLKLKNVKQAEVKKIIKNCVFLANKVNPKKYTKWRSTTPEKHNGKSQLNEFLRLHGDPYWKFGSRINKFTGLRN